MTASSLRILNRREVAGILDRSPSAVLEVIHDAYRGFGAGDVVNPHSSFLIPPSPAASRIIALPAGIFAERPAIGIKWIASFPGNIDKGLERASAVIILNDPETGFPIAILEGAAISACRTAFSASLACAAIEPARSARRLALIGCGLIAAHTYKALQCNGWAFEQVALFDKAHDRAAALRSQLEGQGVRATVHGSGAEAVREGEVVVFATTAGTPWFDDADALSRRPVLLHLSLRDLDPAIIKSSDNYVDDIAHATRAGTSLELAIQLYGENEVAVADMPTLLAGKAPWSGTRPAIFSPFGLGMLDIALADFVLRTAAEENAGEVMMDFTGE